MLSFIPDFLSISPRGFFNNNSALEYSVQIFALRDPYLALLTALQAPSQRVTKLYLIANLPHSANLSWNSPDILVDYCALLGSLFMLEGANEDITAVNSFSTYVSGIIPDLIC